MIYTVRNLSFAYSTIPVLEQVSMEISAGEFVAVVGPNGAGKSTLLKLMVGLLPRFDGTVEFMGKPIGDYGSAELARRVAFVPQETHVVFPFTVEEVILMGRMPYRQNLLFDSVADTDFVHEAMTLTETRGLRGKTFSQISGGERQRVVLASALAQRPGVLLLDEPTVYLDLKHQLLFYEILARLNRDRDMNVVAVTHDINLAARYAGRMIAIRDGAIVADGVPDEVMTSENLHAIFGISAEIIERPGGGKHVIPLA